MTAPQRDVGTSRRTFLRTLRSGGVRALVLPATQFLVLPLVLADLGTARYGVWATLSSLLAVGGLVDVGIRAEIVRRVADGYGSGDLAAGIRSARQGVTVLAATCLVAAAVVVLARDPIVGFAFPDLDGQPLSDARGVLLGLVVLLAVSLVNGGLFAVASGLQRGDYENAAAVIAAVAGAIVTVTLVRQGVGLWGMFWGAASTVGVLVIGQIWATRQVAPALRWPFARLNRRVVRGYLVVSGLLFLSQLGDVVDFQYDKVILSRYVGPDAAAQYQLGTMLALNLRLLALLPLTALLAGTAELWRTSPERAQRLLDAVTALVYALGGLLMTGVFVLAPAFMALWIGPGYSDAATAARLLAVAMVLNLIGAPWTSFAIGRGWPSTPAGAAVANVLTNAVLSLVLVRQIGFEGALLGSIAGNAVGTSVFLVLLWRRSPRNWLAPVVRPALACLLVGSVGVVVVGRVDAVAASWLGFAAAGTALTLLLGLLLVVAAPPHLRAEARSAWRARVRGPGAGRGGPVAPT